MMTMRYMFCVDGWLLAAWLVETKICTQPNVLCVLMHHDDVMVSSTIRILKTHIHNTSIARIRIETILAYCWKRAQITHSSVKVERIE